VKQGLIVEKEAEKALITMSVRISEKKFSNLLGRSLAN
jgi:hypothetical protein